MRYFCCGSFFDIQSHSQNIVSDHSFLATDCGVYTALLTFDLFNSDNWRRIIIHSVLRCSYVTGRWWLAKSTLLCASRSNDIIKASTVRNASLHGHNVSILSPICRLAWLYIEDSKSRHYGRKSKKWRRGNCVLYVVCFHVCLSVFFIFTVFLPVFVGHMLPEINLIWFNL